MIRLRSIGRATCVVGALAASFTACGGSADGLFSTNGGASSIAGTTGSSAGSNTTGGQGVPAGGDANSGGSTSTAGTGVVAGNGSGGGSGNRGGSSGGGHAGSESGGTSSAGSPTGGAAGTSTAGSNSAGSPNGGSESGGNAGANDGGDAGAGSAGVGGTSGSGGAPTCQDLFTRADQELSAARACDNSRDAQQCTGKVSSTCGCQVPVESNNSSETQAYLATLRQIQQRHCNIVCTAIACLPVQRASCVSSPGQTGGMCVASSALPPAR